MFVYKFLNSYKEVIYIGRTKGIRNRLSQHKHLPKSCYNKIDLIQYCKLKNNDESAIYERYLINEIKPKYNVQYKNDSNFRFKLPELTWINYDQNIFKDDSEEELNKKRTLKRDDMRGISDLKLEDFEYLKKSNISIIDHKINTKNQKNNFFSKSYIKKASFNDIDKVRKNISNFFKNICKCREGDLVWTCLPDVKHTLSTKGYTKGWDSLVSENHNYEIRYIAFIYNIYPLEKVNGSNLKSIDEFALKGMLSFLSRYIKKVDDKEITIYIPSRRMRDMLLNWINVYND